MSGLVLSLFPGIGLLDTAFEEEGFCVVRGPDLLWGGDIRRFHPPAGRFDGVIGGPSCQAHSRMAYVVRARGNETAPDMIPEFERCVAETAPEWFLMENVPGAPTPHVDGYGVHAQLVRDVWTGGETMRLRRFSFGTKDSRRLHVETMALHRTDPAFAVMANGARRENPTVRRRAAQCYGFRSEREFREAVRLQGLPDDFDLPGFKLREKWRAVGNGVPLAMGRAVAKAVKAAIAVQREVA